MSIIKEIRKTNEKMKILYDEQNALYEKELSATMYRLFIIHPKEKGLSDKQITSIENTIKNAVKEFPNTTVFITKSTTNKKTAHRVKIKTEGRPKTIIEGEKVPPHVHIGAIGNNDKSARNFIFYVALLLKTRGIKSKNGTVKSTRHKINYINYCWRQADTFHQYGNKNFYFKKYINVL